MELGFIDKFQKARSYLPPWILLTAIQKDISNANLNIFHPHNLEHNKTIAWEWEWSVCKQFMRLMWDWIIVGVNLLWPTQAGYFLHIFSIVNYSGWT